MNIEQAIHFILLGNFLAPFLSAVALGLLLIFQRSVQERTVEKIAKTAFVVYLACALATITCWACLGFQPIKWDFAVISFYFDKAGALYLAITAIISNVIVFY